MSIKTNRSATFSWSAVAPAVAPEKDERTEKEKCRTDCIERQLGTAFEMMGRLVASHPWWFLVIPLILTAAMGSGFLFLEDRMSNDIEEEFTPTNGRAKAERAFIQEMFPEDEDMFSSLRLSTDGTFATVIANSDENILNAESLQKVLDLDLKIRSMEVKYKDELFKFEDVCARVNGACVTNGILDIISYTANNINGLSLTYPWHQLGPNNRIPLFLGLGSVEVDEMFVVKSAKAIQLYYYLQEDRKEITDLWLEHFLVLVSNTTSLSVTFSSSESLQWEFEKAPDSIMPLYSITYAITITFSIVSCLSMDNVWNKVWVASCGLLTTGMSIVSGLGCLLLAGQPFVMPAASSPFLILGIGLDDMFIMISGWQKTNVVDSVPTRLGHTYKDAAISITITSLTNAVALFLGFITPFGSVRSFCLYAGVSVCFCYLYNITFLGACMALNGQREKGNRHWFTCAKVPAEPPADKSKAYIVCCVGGSYDHTTKKEKPGLMNHLFEKFYGPFIIHKWTKCMVLVLYVAYLAVSIYGCVILKQGLDVKNLALDDSYMVHFYDEQRGHFTEYSFNAMVAVKEPVQYWNKTERGTLDSCISGFTNLPYVNGSSGWLFSFEQFANESGLDISTKETFKTNLNQFLDLVPMFKQDVNFSAPHIQASRFFIQTLQRPSTDEEIMTGLRTTAEECSVDLLVYHPSFIYFDQYTVIVDNTIQTLVVAVAVMVVISLLLIPSIFCSLVVVFAICSVIVGVTGLMSLWGVNLDSISMINLVMSVGFSVDFSAHISYSFVSSRQRDPNQKAVEALAHTGYPVVQGAVSTILGVVALSMSLSYIFRTFFKVVFLVIAFGLLHGIVFIPVFLTLFRIPKRCC